MAKETFMLDTDNMEWEEQWSRTNNVNLLKKLLVYDEDTGMSVKRMIYPKGFKTAWHKHPCSHGVYVLRGIFRTNQGEYGPGSFIWFPEGSVDEHGSTDEQEVEVLFITNKNFDITYVENK